MPVKPDIVSLWLDMPYETLIDKVRQLVKQRHLAHETLTTIRVNPVLAARVRGVLAALAAEARGTSDEAMRLVWIKQARQALDPPVRADNHSDQVTDAASSTQPEHVTQPPALPEMSSPPLAQTHQTQPASTVSAVVFRSPGR